MEGTEFTLIGTEFSLAYRTNLCLALNNHLHTNFHTCRCVQEDAQIQMVSEFSLENPT